jgi:molybdopterin-containing oxidoreductase family membrane subunit
VSAADHEHDRRFLVGDPSDEALTAQLLESVLHPPAWIGPALAVSFAVSLLLFGSIAYTVVTGIGVWGNDMPVAWAFGITNFVWWIGIGHAGTFISAILLLLNQKWRTSINRFAEGMTLFAVVQAGLFPLLHMGRPWFFYWLLPYPNTMSMWPQFRSALTWDVVAVTTYLTTSLLFWYLGLVPDLAIVRDRAPERWRRRVYGVFALGWRGSTRDWSHYRIAYGLLAALATPLVISVHSVVSMDFASAMLPGWHSHVFPPYFVAGAIYSGFAMVLTLMIPARRIYKLENVVTPAHLEAMGKMLLLTGCIVTYAYGIEFFTAFYSGDKAEAHMFFHTRARGFIAPCFWIMVVCNCVTPQFLWFRAVRQHAGWLFVLSLFIQLGMWMERFVLIVSSQSEGFVPSSWGSYAPSIIDGTIFVGTLGFFTFLFLLFLRYVPFIPISELKEMRRELSKGGHDGDHAARGVR